MAKERKPKDKTDCFKIRNVRSLNCIISKVNIFYELVQGPEQYLVVSSHDFGMAGWNVFFLNYGDGDGFSKEMIKNDECWWSAND